MNTSHAYLDSVRHEITRLGGDNAKISDEKLIELGDQQGVPAAVMTFDASHPVFGSLLPDGHIIKWIVANWSTITKVAKIAIQILGVVGPLLAMGS